MAERKRKPKSKAKRATKVVSHNLDAATAAIRKKIAIAIGQQLKAEDGPAFEGLCVAIATLDDSQRQVAREPIITLPNGVKAVNPHAKIVDIYRKIVAEGCKRFGLTPADRAKLEENSAPLPPAPSAPRPESEEDDFERHLRSRPATIPLRTQAG